MPKVTEVPWHEGSLDNEAFLTVHPDGAVCRLPYVLLVSETSTINAKRWFGSGPPTVVEGASPGDEYVDQLTGDLYVLE